MRKNFFRFGFVVQIGVVSVTVGCQSFKHIVARVAHTDADNREIYAALCLFRNKFFHIVNVASANVEIAVRYNYYAVVAARYKVLLRRFIGEFQSAPAKGCAACFKVVYFVHNRRLVALGTFRTFEHHARAACVFDYRYHVVVAQIFHKVVKPVLCKPQPVVARHRAGHVYQKYVVAVLLFKAYGLRFYAEGQKLVRLVPGAVGKICGNGYRVRFGFGIRVIEII